MAGPIVPSGARRGRFASARSGRGADAETNKAGYRHRGGIGQFSRSGSPGQAPTEARVGVVRSWGHPWRHRCWSTRGGSRMRAGKEPKVPGLRDYLDRFRPARAPGAGGTGVPADRSRGSKRKPTTVLGAPRRCARRVHGHHREGPPGRRADAGGGPRRGCGGGRRRGPACPRRARAGRAGGAGRGRGPKPSALLLMPKASLASTRTRQAAHPGTGASRAVGLVRVRPSSARPRAVAGRRDLAGTARGGHRPPCCMFMVRRCIGARRGQGAGGLRLAAEALQALAATPYGRGEAAGLTLSRGAARISDVAGLAGAGPRPPGDGVAVVCVSRLVERRGSELQARRAARLRSSRARRAGPQRGRGCARRPAPPGCGGASRLSLGDPRGRPWEAVLLGMRSRWRRGSRR